MQKQKQHFLDIPEKLFTNSEIISKIILMLYEALERHIDNVDKLFDWRVESQYLHVIFQEKKDEFLRLNTQPIHVKFSFFYKSIRYDYTALPTFIEYKKKKNENQNDTLILKTFKDFITALQAELIQLPAYRDIILFYLNKDVSLNDDLKNVLLANIWWFLTPDGVLIRYHYSFLYKRIMVQLLSASPTPALFRQLIIHSGVITLLDLFRRKPWVILTFLPQTYTWTPTAASTLKNLFMRETRTFAFKNTINCQRCITTFENSVCPIWQNPTTTKNCDFQKEQEWPGSMCNNCTSHLKLGRRYCTHNIFESLVIFYEDVFFAFTQCIMNLLYPFLKKDARPKSLYDIVRIIGSQIDFENMLQVVLVNQKAKLTKEINKKQKQVAKITSELDKIKNKPQ